MSDDFDSLQPERIDSRNKRRNYQLPAKKRNNLKEEVARREKVNARFVQRNAVEIERVRKAEQAEYDEINKAYLTKLQRKEEAEKKRAQQATRKEENRQLYTQDTQASVISQPQSDASSEHSHQEAPKRPPPQPQTKPNKKAQQAQAYLAYLRSSLGNQS